MTGIKTVLFDAYGTLFDVHAIAAQLEAWYPGQGQAASTLLRDKQIEYTRLVSQCDPDPAGSRYYDSFWDLTRRALAYVDARLGLALGEDRIAALMAFYLELPAFADCLPVLTALKARGLTLGILSNGNPEMLTAAARASGLAPMLDHLISVQPVRRFKTAPQAYALGPSTVGVPAAEILFVSSNAWDALGAKWFGYRVYWVNRAGLPFETLGPQPDATGRALDGIIAYLAD